MSKALNLNPHVYMVVFRKIENNSIAGLSQTEVVSAGSVDEAVDQVVYFQSKIHVDCVWQLVKDFTNKETEQ